MATVKVTTPKGTLEWVTITGEGKENMSGAMQYLGNLVLDPKDAACKALVAELDAFWEENRPSHVKEPKSMGYYPHTKRTDETDEEGNPVYEETGLLQFTFKTSTTYTSGDPKIVRTFNSKANEVQLGEVAIGNGSVGSISGAYDMYFVKAGKGPKAKIVDAGVTLYLDAIKISKLVEYTQESGFEADDDDEDGWTGDEGWTGDDETKEDTPKPRL